MITPALLEGAVELNGSEYKIYGRLHGILSHGEYRTLKLWPLAQEMRMNKANVGKAMKRLVALGYLREGLRQENGGRSYMLVAVRGEAAKRSG